MTTIMKRSILHLCMVPQSEAPRKCLFLFSVCLNNEECEKDKKVNLLK